MRPIHPGEILREEFLLPLGMSAYALSQAIHVPATRVNDIVNAKRVITTDTALRLAATSAITRARAESAGRVRSPCGRTRGDRENGRNRCECEGSRRRKLLMMRSICLTI